MSIVTQYQTRFLCHENVNAKKEQEQAFSCVFSQKLKQCSFAINFHHPLQPSFCEVSSFCTKKKNEDPDTEDIKEELPAASVKTIEQLEQKLDHISTTYYDVKNIGEIQQKVKVKKKPSRNKTLPQLSRVNQDSEMPSEEEEHTQRQDEESVVMDAGGTRDDRSTKKVKDRGIEKNGKQKEEKEEKEKVYEWGT